ncbi:hypothetical protein CJ307_35315, partial [Klebsiella quasipneumoniae]
PAQGGAAAIPARQVRRSFFPSAIAARRRTVQATLDNSNHRYPAQGGAAAIPARQVRRSFFPSAIAARRRTVQA